jgi:hypothetical protein
MEKHESSQRSNLLNMYQSSTKNLESVKKHNSYRKKFVMHEPAPDNDEVSFDLKSIITEEEEEEEEKQEEINK